MEVEQKQRAGSSLWLGEAAGVFLATSTSQPPWHGGRERQRAWIEPHVCYLHSGRAGHEKYIYLCTWWDLSRPDSLVQRGAEDARSLQARLHYLASCRGYSISPGQTPLSGGLQKILALPVVSERDVRGCGANRGYIPERAAAKSAGVSRSSPCTALLATPASLVAAIFPARSLHAMFCSGHWKIYVAYVPTGRA